MRLRTKSQKRCQDSLSLATNPQEKLTKPWTVARMVALLSTAIIVFGPIDVFSTSCADITVQKASAYDQCRAWGRCLSQTKRHTAHSAISLFSPPFLSTLSIHISPHHFLGSCTAFAAIQTIIIPSFFVIALHNPSLGACSRK